MDKVTHNLTVPGTGTDHSYIDQDMKTTASPTHRNANLICYSATITDYPDLIFQKSHNNTSGVNTQTIDTDVLGDIDFQGINNASNPIRGVLIRAVQNGAAVDYCPTDLIFYTATSLTLAEKMRLTSTGYLGIGCTPDHLLHINKTGASTLKLGSGATPADYGRIDFYGNPAGAGQSVLYITAVSTQTGSAVPCGAIEIAKENNTGDDKTFLTFSTFGSSLGERMRLTSAGYLGIGCTPTTILDVNGAIRTMGSLTLTNSTGSVINFNDTFSDSGKIEYVHGDHAMIFKADNTEIMRINSAKLAMIYSGTANWTVTADTVNVATNEVLTSLKYDADGAQGAFAQGTIWGGLPLAPVGTWGNTLGQSLVDLKFYRNGDWYNYDIVSVPSDKILTYGYKIDFTNPISLGTTTVLDISDTITVHSDGSATSTILSCFNGSLTCDTFKVTQKIIASATDTLDLTLAMDISAPATLTNRRAIYFKNATTNSPTNSYAFHFDNSSEFVTDTYPLGSGIKWIKVWVEGELRLMPTYKAAL